MSKRLTKNLIRPCECCNEEEGKWHFRGYISGYKPSHGLLQQILEHFCAKYHKSAGNSYWYEKLSHIEYTIRTGRAWWLPKWYTNCFGGKPHTWASTIQKHTPLEYCTKCKVTKLF